MAMVIPHPPSHTPLQPLPSAAIGAASRARAEQRGARRREVDLAVSGARWRRGEHGSALRVEHGGGRVRSATNLAAQQRVSDGFGGARRQQRS
jgi:hypothetical protein